ncbi:MAG: hypothetical protein V2I36_02575 [Desulfopila sp.]|jgi:hypothetical protein|nr:hypothetical protein [Desulfopila sp.]
MVKSIFALAFCVASVLAFNTISVAADYSITQITDNNGGGQQISDNGIVVYVSQNMSSSNRDLFLYNSTTKNTVPLIENDNLDDSDPIMNAVGDIVWKRKIGPISQLFLYDRSTSPPTITQITNSSSEIYSPHINNDRDIVYSTRPSDGSDSEVFLYVRETGETIRLTDNNEYDGAPKICGNGDVVWTHNDGDDEVYLFKRSSHQLVILSNNDYQDYYVGSGGVNAKGDVAWRATMPGSNDEIFLYEGSSNTVTQFENVPCDDDTPDLNDNGDLVWSMSCPGADREIVFHNGVTKTTTPLTSNAWDDYLPNINNTRDVVWKGYSAGRPAYELYVYDSFEKSITKLTDNNYEENNINFNNRSQIVWHAQVGPLGSSEIEVFLASPTVTPPPDENAGNANAWMLLLLD